MFSDFFFVPQTRLNIQEIALPSAAPAPAAAAPAEEAAAEEKPKEKTIFNVMLKSFDATAKPKIIREVKALVPNLTLIDVSARHYDIELACLCLRLSLAGEEVRRVRPKSPQGESSERRRR